jgi:hypothetical protein
MILTFLIQSITTYTPDSRGKLQGELRILLIEERRKPLLIVFLLAELGFVNRLK